MPLGNYMTVTEVFAAGRKTRRWRISNRRGPLLGIVEWYSRWRQYVFTPWIDDGPTVFNADCLSAIHNFVRRANENHRAALRLASAVPAARPREGETGVELLQRDSGLA